MKNVCGENSVESEDGAIIRSLKLAAHSLHLCTLSHTVHFIIFSPVKDLIVSIQIVSGYSVSYLFEYQNVHKQSCVETISDCDLEYTLINILPNDNGARG